MLAALDVVKNSESDLRASQEHGVPRQMQEGCPCYQAWAEAIVIKS